MFIFLISGKLPVDPFVLDERLKLYQIIRHFTVNITDKLMFKVVVHFRLVS